MGEGGGEWEKGVGGERWGGGGGEQGQEQEVTWSFTPSQPVRLYMNRKQINQKKSIIPKKTARIRVNW